MNKRLTPDELKAKELSQKVKALGGSPVRHKLPPPTKRRPLDFKNDYAALTVRNGAPGAPGKDGSADTPQAIANKLNTLESSVEAKVIAGLLTLETVIAELKKGQYLEPKNIKGMPINMSDMRWHGGGLSSVIHDTTLTGTGTASSPLSVVSSGSGTVTSVSVVSANGFAGTVATATTTPAITLTTTITGLLKGNGTAISAAAAGTDYQAPISLTTTGTSGVATFIANTLNIPVYQAAGTYVTSVSGTSNRITSSGGTTPAIDISAAYVGQTSITTLGTVTTGTLSTGAVIAGVTMTLGSDATGDIYYRAAGGVLTRLAIGSSTNVLTVSGGLPSWAAAPAASLVVGTTTITSGTTTRILYDNAGVLGEYTLTGTGTVAVMQNTPTLTTPNIGVATATSVNGLVISTTTGTFTLTNAKTLAVTNSLTLSGTDSTTMTFPTTSATIARTDAGNTFTGSSTTSGWVETSPTITTKISPTTDDGAPLGDTTHNFSDLFLASGALINIANGNWVATHTSGILTVTTGDLRVTSANVGTNADSVPTLSSTSTLTNKTLTSPTIQTSPVFAAGTSIKLTVPSSDLTGTGATTNEFNSGYSSTAIGDLVYLDSSATWQKADADASAATYSSMLGIALSVAASGAAVNVLLQGFVYAASPFPTFTIGAPIYMSATAGAVTQTAPVTTDSATRVLGYGVHADKMYFNPSNDYITHT